ncbi:dynamin family protein [Schinkia azotoformans MEV2011]|uniref:Dynamin family protein n=1 Tax=Schinkia azotoformans MEV2011 TaxID=1348973 RepID=A0A072NV03_SCHAZ|nr:dynamin family protein [Schinkia azotoformans]KEF37070.1 dynamin family protein [Schinkia azotoformans MEV2011]MEC1697693.1 dynamin family protein [Schinkia azotoformans]MEC1727449.1 dynamin family protein [Schinkia azotoformans]MEC1780878.1 dynamin family protein [Schinkia azotoformans]MED4328424.1 dynamin family protein [Schinkia azotoformans]
MLEINRLAALYLELQEKGDNDNAEKVKQLVEKLKSKEFMIAFCGHFSAGKSTMMNHFMGKEVLPSSPIPTSANLVKIKKGKSYARVYYKEADPVEFPAPYDFEAVKNFAKDGENIISIEISDEDISLPEGVAIMDTPGIDSTDDAHRISTESALHLADIVLYVMDYNHVQSELNFSFTKTLKDREKPVYLVINMIDKHNEEELSFESYKTSVIEAFKSWGVNIDGLFFTSLKDLNHPLNEYSRLDQFLKNQINNKEELLLQSVLNSAKPLIEDHLLYFDNEHDDARQDFEAQLEDLPENERKQVLQEVTDLEESQASLQYRKSNLKEQYEDEIKKILDNAYLMPAATRDLAHSFIEACQPDFKIGFLFSKKKTEEERVLRLNAFYESFKKQVEAQLDWHIKDFSVKFFKQNQIDNEDFINSIFEELTVGFSSELLEGLVKKGAGLTGEYILNYTNDVSNELKRLYKNRALEKFEEGKDLIYSVIDRELSEVEANLANYTQYKRAVDGLKMLQQERNSVEIKLLALLSETLEQYVLEATNNWLKQFKGTTPSIEIKQMEMAEHKELNGASIEPTDQVIDNVLEINPEQDLVQSVDSFNVKERLGETVAKLKTAISSLNGIKGIHTLASDMAAKANRLNDNRFTIALFGAFSAGKSSFANALIGDKLLPVSPNPTTATINKILPSSAEHPHGTVLVKIKTKEQIFKDVEQSLALFQKKCASMEDALSVINSLSYEGNDPKEKPHYSFLKAVHIGYDFIAPHLGELLTVDLKAFEDYVAKEEKSCFVEWIELYYDCPLTEQGITLVDTPGADSINARHTGVAFEYIKNADAILFVTYYNHAFSRADREFLIQLGRVKEAFEMDKMFFIVNAADLAKSEEELKLVVDYVGDELKKFGIRFPRIYPLSSKMALEEKLQAKEGKSVSSESRITAFEQAFYSFIMNDLVQISIQTAHEDLKRSVAALQNIIATAKESDEVKEQKRQNAEKAKGQIHDKLKSKEFKVEERSLAQEVEELLFYVAQRVFYRFSDFYNEAFNPSSLRDDGRDLKKAIQSCLDELLVHIGFDLSQELRATSLRIENHINKLLKEVHCSMEGMIDELHPIPLLPVEARHFETMDFENALEKISRDPFKSVLSIFKSPKSFFEQGGKGKLRDGLEEQLKEPVHSYIEKQTALLKDVYHTYLLSSLEDVLKEIAIEVDDYFEGYFAALSETIDIEKLESARSKIQSIL